MPPHVKLSVGDGIRRSGSINVQSTVAAILRLNPRLADKFAPELKEGLGWEKIKKHGKNLREATTALILERHNALQTDQVRRLFSRLVGADNIFVTEERERTIRRFIEHRHIIVHRAGKIDRKFREVTGSRQALDTRVELTTSFVSTGLEELKAFAGDLQQELETRSRGVVESAPP